MNTQINLRMPQKLLSSVRFYSDEHGFGSIQDFIKETIREVLKKIWLSMIFLPFSNFSIDF